MLAELSPCSRARVLACVGRPVSTAAPETRRMRPPLDQTVRCRCLDVLLHMPAGQSALLQAAPGQPSLLHQLLACALSPEALMQQEAALQPLYDATDSLEGSAPEGVKLSQLQAEAAALSVLLPCRAALHMLAAMRAAAGPRQAADTSCSEPAHTGDGSGEAPLLPGQDPAPLLDAAFNAALVAGRRLLRQLDEAGPAATADSLVRRAVC